MFFRWPFAFALMLSIFAASGTPSFAADPAITGQPKPACVPVGTNQTFQVTAAGTAPFAYQWQFQGAALANQTNASLTLTGIQTNQAGAYRVIVTNSFGAVTSAVAFLTVRLPDAPIYLPPTGAWTYLYDGNSAANPDAAALDGTWNHNNGTDSWALDGRGAGNGPIGGVGTTNGILTLEDDLSAGTGSDNRRLYFTRALSLDSVANANTLLNDGVTLSFRARLTPSTDPLIETTNAPNGFINTGDGKGMIGLRQFGSSGSIISFSLNLAAEDTNATTLYNFPAAGLHMNSLNGNTRGPQVDPGEGGTVNLLPLDPTMFHEFWITIQDNGADAGTHRVSVYVDGVKVGTNFNVTAGSGLEANTNYLAIGLPSTTQVGAFDLDYLAYRPGVFTPVRVDEPATFTSPPTGVSVAEGQMATFNVGVTGTPPISIQWYQNGTPIPNATNSSYTTAPVVRADDGTLFSVLVSNLCNVEMSAAALLDVEDPPVITAQPQSLTVTNGDTAAFSVAATGTAPLRYQWRFKGSAIPDATNSALVIPGAGPANAGAYDVIVSNGGGQTTSNPATLTVNAFDFGDAPAPYPSALGQNGARHLLAPGVYLGAAVDFEIDANTTGAATGDDLSGSDDEDGVRFVSTLGVGQTAQIEVVASTNGILNAWIDFDANGSWAEAGNQIFTNRALTMGTNILNFLVPASAKATNTFARFRFSTTSGAGPTGTVSDGEVEDYAVTLVPIADLAISVTDAPDPVAVGSNLTYTVTVSNSGPSSATQVLVTNLVSNLTVISAVPSQGSCTQNGGVVNCPLGTLGSGSNAVITITAQPLAGGGLTNTFFARAAESDPNAANNSAVAITTVELPPTITSQPSSLTVTQGVTAQFSVTNTGTAPFVYQWFFNSGALASATNSTLAVTNAQTVNAGSYQARITNRVGAVMSQIATLTVLVPPSITQQPQNSTNFAGSTATLAVVAAGTTPLAYQWFFNVTNALVSGTNAALVLTNVQVSQRGTYSVRVANAAGIVNSTNAFLEVIEMDFGDAPAPFPTLFSDNGARHRVVQGFRLGPLIDFEPDGQPQSLADGDDNQNSDDEDGVRFLTSLIAGQAANVEVLASSNGVLNVWMDWNGNGSWADAGEQLFANRSVTNGTNVLAFTVPTTATSGNRIARFRLSTQSGLSFTGEALDGEVEDHRVSVAAAAEMSLTAQAQPSPAIVGSNLVYQIVFTNKGPSAASGVVLTSSFPANVSIVSSTPSQGTCSNSGSRVICDLGVLASGAGGQAQFTVMPSQAGTVSSSFYIKPAELDVLLANNEVILNVEAYVFPQIVSQPQSLTVTNGSSASFGVTANGTALTYQWTLAGTNIPNATNLTYNIAAAQTNHAGAYQVRVANPVGAVVSASAQLTVLVPPSITAQPTNRTVVLGETASFSVTASGTTPLRFQWSANAADLPGETNATFTITNAQSSHEGTYRVKVSNSAGEILSNPAQLTVLIPPTITTQPQSQTIFAGEGATLQVVATGTDPLSYQWYFNRTNLIPSAISAALTRVNLQKTNTGDYFVALSNRAAVVTSLVARLTVNEADFGDADGVDYATLRVFDGAYHIIVPGFYLGQRVDFETDGQPHPLAQGDDLAGQDDEDGVRFPSALLAGQLGTCEVIASTNGFLDAWVDFDGNGTWIDPGEQIYTARALSTGTNMLTFMIPPNTRTGSAAARFRFSATGNLAFSGPASEGEVEDYLVTISPAVDLGVRIVDVPDPVTVETVLQLGITVSNAGPSTANGVLLRELVPATATLIGATPSQGSCSNSATEIVCDLGAVPAGMSVGIDVQMVPHRIGMIQHRAEVSGAEQDFRSTNNVALESTAVVFTSDPFQNADPINLPEFGKAETYPSTLFVSGVTGTVFKVMLSLNGLSHEIPDDLDILLVGPGGQKAIVMSDAGGINALSFITINFDEDSGLTLPDNGRIVSQAYRSSNYEGVNDAFAAPGPPGPYAASLNTFRGTDPNGTWSLYIVDDFAGGGGALNGGWSLRFVALDPIGDAAVVMDSSPNPLVLEESGTIMIDLTNRGPAAISHAALTNTVSGNLTLNGFSSTQGSCTNTGAQIICDFGAIDPGAFARLNLSVTPHQLGSISNFAAVGAAEVDFSVANNSGLRTFAVQPRADVGVSQLDSQDPVSLGQPFSYSLLVSNRGPQVASGVLVSNRLPASLQFASATSTKGSCSQSAGIVMCDLGTLAVGESATIQITGSGTQVTSATNLTQVFGAFVDTNQANNISIESTTVVFAPPAFANTTVLNLPAGSIASRYPSTIQVSGLTGAVYTVSVIISNLTHTVPEGLDLLLVGPAGQKVLLMSAAGGSTAVNNLTLQFDQAVMGLLADSGPLVSGIFRPSNYNPSLQPFLQPAPGMPYGNSLLDFQHSDPNGSWSLFVRTTGTGTGQIGAWALKLSTFEAIADVALSSVAAPQRIAIGSNFTYAITVTNRGPAVASGILVSNQLPAAAQFVSATASQGGCSNMDGIVVCDVGSLPSGAAAQINLTVNSSTFGLQTNLAQVFLRESDLNPTNNISSAVASVEFPPAITVQPQSQMVTNGDTVTFTIVATGTPALSIQWLHDGVAVSGGTSATLVLSNVAASDRGAYVARVSNAVGVALSDNAQLAVSIRPTISDIPDLSLFEDIPSADIPFVIGDLETSADALTLEKNSSNPALIPAANIVLGGSGNNRVVRIIPALNQFGSATITLLVRDVDGLSASDSFQVTVAPSNDLPTISAIADQSLAEDTSLVVNFSVADIETAAGALNVTVMSDNTALTPTSALALGGLASDRTLTITPPADQFGSAIITLRVEDADTGVSTRSFALQVSGVNDPPTLNALSDVTIDESSGPVTIALTGISPGPNESQALTLSASYNNSNLLATLAVDYQTGSTGVLSFAAKTNAIGNAAITVTVNDGGASNNVASRTFNLVVVSTNKVPTISQIGELTIPEDTASGPIAFTIGDVETPANDLIVEKGSSNPALIPAANIFLAGTGSARSVSVLPVTNQFGSTTITLTVRDGDDRAASTTFSVSVLPVADPPAISAIPDQQTLEDTETVIPFTLTSVDTPLQLLQIAAESTNTNLVSTNGLVFGGTSVNRTLTVRPTTNQFGFTTINVKVTNTNGTMVTESFDLIVQPVNDAPTLDPIANIALNEDAPVQTVVLTNLTSGVPNESQLLSISVSSSNPALIPEPVISFHSANNFGTLTFTPVPNASGNSIIMVTVDDHGVTNNQTVRTFTVTVNPVNDLPTIFQILNQATAQDTPLVISFTVDDLETAPGSLQVTTASDNSQLVQNLLVDGTNASRILRITPAPGKSGTATISVTVTDANSGAATISFVLTVLGTNSPPTIADIADRTLQEDTSSDVITFNVHDQETPDGDLQVTATSSNPALVPNANLLLDGAGSARTISFTPVRNRTGSAVITVVVRDNDGGVASDSFLVQVQPVNDPPTISGIPDITMNQNRSMAVPFTIGDAETAFANLLVAAGSSNPAVLPNTNLIVTGAGPDRALTFSPATDQVGTAVITISVTDEATNTAIATFSVRVLPLADPVLIVAQPASQTISNGATLNLTVGVIGSSPISYRWFFNSSPIVDATNSTFSIPNAQVANSGDYFVIASNSVGSITSTVAAVTVLASPTSLPPTIANILDQSTPEDTAINIPFSIQDPDTTAAFLAVSATSGNTTLVPQAGLTFQGSGTNRTLTIVPAANLSGTSLITVTVSDGTSNASDSFLLTVSAVNDPPTLDPIPNLSGVERTTYTVPLTGISAGGSGESGSLSITAASSNTALIPTPIVTYTPGAATGSLAVRPANKAFGPVTITVTVSDGAASTVRTFTVYCRDAANANPTISAIGNQTINEDATAGPITFTVTDATTPASLLSVAATSSDTNLLPAGSILLGGAGNNRTLTITPAPNASGAATIFLSVTDTNFGFVGGSFTLTVNPMNDLPTISAVPNQVINENAVTSPLAITIGDVETFASALNLTATSLNNTLIPNANLTLGGSGSNRVLVATPLPNQSGVATIQLVVSDGNGGSASTNFTVTVLNQNDPPSISPIANVTVPRNGSSPAIAFTVSDPDTSAENLTLDKASSNPALIPLSGIVFGGSGGNRTVSVTPAPNQSGTAVITVTVSDGAGGSASGSFVVQVPQIETNSPPTFDGLADLAVNEDSAAQTIPLTGITAGPGDSGQVIAISALSSNPDLIPHPAISYVSPASVGSLTFEPSPATNGVVQITVNVNDGFSLLSRTFTVMVRARPIISTIGDVVINEDTPTGLLPFTVSDAETTATNLNVVITSSNPTLVPNFNLVASGLGANRTLQVTPAPDRFGSALITLTVSDQDGLSRASSFVLTVLPVNDSPAFDPIGDTSIFEDQGPQVISISGISAGPNEIQPLMIVAASSNPALVASPTVNYTSPSATGSLQFIPVPGASGSAQITVTLTDGQNANQLFSRTFTVVVNPVDDPPTLNPIQDVAVDEDSGSHTVLITGISSGDANAGQPVTVTAISSNPAIVPHPSVAHTGSETTGVLTFAPAPDAFGSVVITVSASDGASTVSESFSIRVNPVSDGPSVAIIPNQVIDEDQTLGPLSFMVNDENAGVDLSLSAVSSNPALVAVTDVLLEGTGTNRTLTIHPQADQFGSTTITIIAQDPAGLSASNSFVLTVNAVNDPPRFIVPVTAQTMSEDSIITVPFTIWDAETAPNELVLDRSSDNDFAVPTGGITFGGTGTNRTITLLAHYNHFGTANVQIRVRDGAGVTTTNTFFVTVLSVEDPPTTSRIGDVSILEDQSVDVGFLVDDGDAPPETLNIFVQSSNANLISASDILTSGTGFMRMLHLTPKPDQNGVSAITVTIRDATGLESSQTFQLRVTAVNDLPTISPLPNLETNVNSTLGPLTFSIGDKETVVDQLTLTAFSSNTNLIPIAGIAFGGVTSNRTVTITPATNQFGFATITMEVADGNGGKAQTQFEVTVHQLTGAPLIALDPQPQTVLSGSTVTLRVVATGPSPLSYRWQRNGGDILGANASTLVFPSIQRGNTGDYRVVVSNSDGSATSASARVQVYDAARIISLSRSGNVVQLSFNTTLGQRYTIEYRDSLNSGTWTMLEAVDGTGSVVTRSDSTATGAARFYRLRVD